MPVDHGSDGEVTTVQGARLAARVAVARARHGDGGYFSLWWGTLRSHCRRRARALLMNRARVRANLGTPRWAGASNASHVPHPRSIPMRITAIAVAMSFGLAATAALAAAPTDPQIAAI